MQILEDFGLVEGRICTHVETVGSCICPHGALYEVRRSLDASCPTCREDVKPCYDTFWEHGVLRDHLRVHACLFASRSHVWQTVWV
jgi:hypothetical protein